MLTASGIFKNYGKLPVLRGVDIGIAKGEIVRGGNLAPFRPSLRRLPVTTVVSILTSNDY